MSTELLLILFTVVPVYRIDSADSTMDMERISEDVFYSLKKKKDCYKIRYENPWRDHWSAPYVYAHGDFKTFA